MSATRPLSVNGLLLQLLGLVLATVFALGLQARERANGPRDAYGYSVFDGPQPGACRFDYVDLGEAGRALAMQPGHGGAAADDAAADIELARPFEFYQQPRKALVVSANGYLAAAGSRATKARAVAGTILGASTSGSWLTICSAMNTAWQYSARVSSSATL